MSDRRCRFSDGAVVANAEMECVFFQPSLRELRGNHGRASSISIHIGCYPRPLLIEWIISFLILIAKQARAYTPIGFDFLRYERHTASPRGGGGERRTKTPS